ncbi:PREDICTED: endothelial cell-specific molecule 1 isoform X2 [Acanthisitta chloris]|uniref:endothelial cell-specific molecule 1 isoform X2 n=1 Tax=Acanthisitta chloris TaxID=57068 RepID=UPI0004F0F84D|nr:PREDICTED: endothelial cell-specific molecule 1 isoform X2 [Acanthisitta chloris]
MKGFLLLTLLLMPVHAGTAWSAKYAVDCPEPCDSNSCKSTLRCKRTVLDDCGCCRVCAAALGETCYRTVSGMDGVKCGPGLKCQFYTEEDDFGDEFGICKESDMASGDGNSVKEEFVKEKGIHSPVMKWLNPR